MSTQKRKLVENADLESQHLSRKRKVARCQYHPLARYYHQIRPVPPQHRSGHRVNYTKAREATRRRMKVSARIVLQNTVGQCNEISQGDGWDLLQDVTANTPIKKCANEGKKYQQKISEVMDGLSQTYEKEAHGATGKIRLLTTIVPHFKNKELKNAFQCTDYERTEARKYAQQHGPGATVNKVKQVR